MAPDATCCKAGRVAAQYGFTEKLTGKLGNQWEADDGPGLRRLADQFNILVINAARLAAGEPSLDGESELLYRLLTDDEVEAAEQARARRRLEEQGIDPDDLTDAFLSYRTLDRHFKNCTVRERNISSEPVTADSVLNRVNALKKRVEQVTAKSITEVAQHTDIGAAGSDIDVIVQISVVCSECGDRMSLRDLLADGCNCATSTDHTPDPTATDTSISPDTKRSEHRTSQ